MWVGFALRLGKGVCVCVKFPRLEKITLDVGGAGEVECGGALWYSVLWLGRCRWMCAAQLRFTARFAWGFHGG